jgi:hypothetical protein
VSHQFLFMTNEVVIAKFNQLFLDSRVRKETIKKQSRGERILLLIYQNQQKLIDEKRKRK